MNIMANGGEDPQSGHRLRRVGGCGAVVGTRRLVARFARNVRWKFIDIIILFSVYSVFSLSPPMCARACVCV